MYEESRKKNQKEQLSSMSECVCGLYVFLFIRMCSCLLPQPSRSRHLAIKQSVLTLIPSTVKKWRCIPGKNPLFFEFYCFPMFAYFPSILVIIRINFSACNVNKLNGMWSRRPPQFIHLQKAARLMSSHSSSFCGLIEL